MAKIDEATLVREATTGSDLRVSIRRTLRGTIAAKWPRKRGKWNTPAQFYQQQEFGLASRAASNAEPIALASAYNIAKGSQQVARDLIVMASYGLLYEIKFMDGTVVTRYRDVTTNAQLTLDQVTSNPGDLIYRSTLGWIGIPPSNNSFVLTMHNQVVS
jgi:hypothetical protein